MGRAIVRNPKVFLMDEPRSNLDAKLRVQMRIETVSYTHLFPVLSRFENTVKNTIRNSFLMSVLNLPKTILLIIINLIPTVHLVQIQLLFRKYTY